MSISRRQFIEAGAGGIALLIGVSQAGCTARDRQSAGPTDPPFGPSQWLRIGADGRVTVISDKSEMGQGATSALPLIVAAELGARWDQLAVELPEPGPDFSDMGTSGSDSVESRWRPLRKAAAAAREMLIAAGAARWSVPPAECIAADGNITHRPSNRSLPFGKLVAAAAKLPVPEAPTLRADAELTLVGTRVSRLDTPSVVTGLKKFGIDMRVPGMLRAALARSPVPGGHARSFSDTTAKAIAGVRGVYRIPPHGIAVVADTTWAAFKGREALTIDWDESPGKGIDSDALWTQLTGGFGRFGKVARQEGDVRAALSRASRRMEAEYRYPFQAHVAVEPLNAIADVRDGGKRAELWIGTQNANNVQASVAEALGIKPEQVTVHVLPLGGAFGRRISADFAVEAAAVSRAANAPVHLVWSREDDIAHDMYQSAAVVRMEAGIDGKGTITGWSHEIADFHLSMFGDFNPAQFNPREDGQPWGGIDTPYAFPALSVKIARQSPPVRTGAWRSVFYPSSVFARECFLDEIAHSMGKDPLALRLELLAAPQLREGGGLRLDQAARLRAVLSLAANKAGWSSSLQEHPGRKVGRGIAANIYHGRTVIATVAEVSVGATGDVVVHRIVTAMECGRAVNLDGVEAQIEGGTTWALSTLFGKEITFRGGRTEQLNYDTFPVLRIDRAPRIESHVIQTDSPPFGVGEQPVPCVIPAVLNGVFAATGNRIRRVPV